MALSADVARLEAAAPDYVESMRRFQRRNFVCLTLDGATFAFAIALLSETTIIPAFVRALAEAPVLIGLVAATYALGRYFPQLIGAHLVIGRARRKPTLLAIALTERVGILAIALSAQLIGVVPDGAVLAVFFVAFGCYAVTTGLIGPVYGDLVAKALTRSRGWYYGLVQLIGGVLGFSAAMLGEHLIRVNGFPVGIQACFWTCLALSSVSIFFILGIKEIPYPLVTARGSLRQTIARIPGEIRENGQYARYIGARALLASSTMGVGFVVVQGLEESLLPADAALLAAVFILSQAALGFLLGLVGNYLGWRVVVVAGGVLVAAGMVSATAVTTLPGYVGVFVALGGANAVTIIADPNMSIELAPPDRTSLYLGITSTVLAPFFVLAPLLAGALVDPVGYDGVFLASACLAAAGIVLALRVAEPRRLAAADPVGQPGAMP